ncbi:MAG: hydroxyacylglutathione hydrolase [Gammaproteobacteria bacterium RIFCSPHIGHO2_12_FULL_41_15]|nr:MAG: hydroxyacylglutathione hydrolase [Gammaproteobacteria bacterium RIFCSPHIGHO2_12_FULL_41_15]
MPHQIIAIPALHDNYIWAIVHAKSRCALVIDPGEAEPVLHWLKDQQLQLIAILITHHHWDHTNGIPDLLQTYPVPVYAPAKDTVTHCTHPVKEGDTVSLPKMALCFNVLKIPGHTLGHIAYQEKLWVFTGDTLFTGGCGRLFEGTPDQLYHSLDKLAHLSPKIRVYCGHEYTVNNLSFALQVEPNNFNLKRRAAEAERTRANGFPTVPSTLGLELRTNPFLRCHLPEIQRAVEMYCGQPLADTVAVFAALRRWKDEF